MKPSQEHSDAIFYQTAADEVKNGNVDDGLLAKAAVKAEGDKKKAEALYIEWRVALLIEQAAEDAKFADADAKKTKDVDNFGWLIAIVPAIIIIVALMLKSPSKTQKVIVIQPPGISIHKAADRGNIEAVKQHLNAGTDVNAKGSIGQTALHDAAINGHNEIAKLLISKGADVDAKKNPGETPLHAASRALAGLEFAGDTSEWPADLSVDGIKEIVELLIANGADVNMRDREGLTPLDYASPVNRAIAAILRKHGGKTGEELKAEGK